VTPSLACASLLLCAHGAVAQNPTPTSPPPSRPPRDTVRGPSRDTLPAAASDSATRDSVVTRILAQDSAGTVRPAAFSLLGLDRLRLRTVGVSLGSAWPGQALPTRLYSLHADYGEIYPGVRVIFVSSYWATRYTDAEVAQLARAVEQAVEPTRTDTVQLGRIHVSDLSAGTDVRWEPGLARRAHQLLRIVRPWVGGGVAVHFVNVEGPPVSGTFVERALDAASIGLGGALGLDLSPLPNVQLTAQARYDFVGTVRYGSLRAGASFVFGPLAGGRP
jgi:hypothetical protein